MKDRILHFVFFTISCIFFVVFLISFSCLVLNKDNKLEKKENQFVPRQYQYFEKNHFLNETSFGIVSLLEEISGFVSYTDYKLGKEVLISPFGSEEYQCYGSCFCEESNSRRVVQTNVLVQGMSYLLAAVSLFAAFDITKEYFEQKCEEKFSNICKSELVQVEVEKCENVAKNYFEETKTPEKRVYFCYGNCIDRRNPKPVEYRPTASDMGMECRTMKRQGEMIVYSNDLVVQSPNREQSHRMSLTAQYRFQQYYLVDFCKEYSRVEYLYNQPTHYKNKSGEKRSFYQELKKFGSVCAGFRRSSLENVHCRQIDPEPKSRNTAWMNRVWWAKKREWDQI